jgi:diguanylate cyclase (GGDEF)-like protein
LSTHSDEAYESLIQFLYRAPVGMVQTNLAGDIEMANPMSAQLLMPVSPDGNFENLFSVLKNVAPQVQNTVAAFGESSGMVCEGLRFSVNAPANPLRHVKTLSANILKFDGASLMAMFSDVTLEVEAERKKLARDLRDASRVDVLTQLPNRQVIKEHLARLMESDQGQQSREFAVLFMNCDRFKRINDSLGPQVGDAVLGMIADRLRSTLRLTDRVGLGAGQMAARLGGDEFVVLLDDLQHPDDAHIVAQRLIDVLSKPFGIGTHSLYCSVSMGIVLKAQASSTPDSVLQDASIAMVEAKRRGGARSLMFETAMQAQAAKRASIEVDLRQALQENQLFVVFQPVVGFTKEGFVDCAAGVEALVRWQHPVKGVIPPFEFIGVAEECGLIGALGDFVLASSCQQFMRWKDELGGMAPRLLAVNLSRSQLSQPGFVASVKKILDDCNMSAGELQLEITESLAAQDESVQRQLHLLKALGLTLALDDFGTGYSSLSSLHQFPVDIVKIDRSFTCLSDTSEHHRVLIDATVKVAASLGMHTVAEGIETEEQSQVIKRLGCDKGQGYLYSKPLTSEQLVEWLRNRTSA